ncbi:MAG TPA: hypothetical protein VEA69_15905 [Tepidisphaeraceae bacterium]|nr:hypothetical protein [Tepidisphaeraceae bacterium]
MPLPDLFALLAQSDDTITRVPRGVGKFIAAIGALVLGAIAAALYQKFPAHRKQLCVACIALGAVGLGAGAVFANVAGDEARDAYAVPMITVLVAGALFAGIGLFLLRKYQRGD